jgi:type II secretory pathway component GspD/PulD (secretin)
MEQEKRPLFIRSFKTGLPGFLLPRKIIFSLFFCMVLICPASGFSSRLDTVIIRLKFRVATEALPVVENMLSQEGKATADPRTNSLVVTDDEESIRTVNAFLADFDKPGKQVKISVRFDEVDSMEGRSVSTKGRVSGKHWSVGTAGKRGDGVDVRLKDRNSYRKGTSEYSIITMSGSAAYILAGKEVPYRQRWTYLSRRYAGYVDTVVLRRIETGMEVTPTVMGNSAQIEITPRISHEDRDGRRGVVRFTNASTVLSAPLGRWVTIGGTDQRSNEVIREILKSGDGTRDSSLVISLKVETY